MNPDTALKQKFKLIWPHLDERSRRLFAATEARSLGFGGITTIQRICGLSRPTLTKGIKELDAAPLTPGRVRKQGAGRHCLAQNDPGLEPALETLLEATTRGDPQSPLRWICKSTRAIARQLADCEHGVCHVSIASMLKAKGYSLQANSKTEEGSAHPDRDAQFHHINGQVKQALAKGQPVISVDTKKKELLGNYDNKGRQWRQSKQPRKVNGHDFPDPEVPRAHPYGIYEIGRNKGFVNIGTDHDTAAFAGASIRGWWKHEGKKAYAKARWLVITADSGGSNAYRSRLWKVELQTLADEMGMPIRVCHFPAGTSKWNKIEHRLFSFISSNWRGEPLRDYETIVRLIGATKTAKGLSVTCRLDHGKYPIGRRVTNEQMKSVRLEPMEFHGEWNYIIHPETSGKT